MLNNNKCILAYGLSEDEIKLLEGFKHKIKIITKEMSSMKIKDILGGLKFEVVNKELPEEKILLFNNYDDASVKKGVTDIRSNIKGTILAVVTPTSKEWTFEYLLEHLVEEREWAKKQQQKKGR